MNSDPAAVRDWLPRLRLGLVLSGELPGTLAALLSMGTLEVRAVCPIGENSDSAVPGRDLGARLVSTITDLCRIEELDVLVNLTNDPAVSESLDRHRPPGTTVLDRSGIGLLERMVQGENELRKVTLIKEQFDTILSAAQEGIQLADRNGILLYVNPAFTRITGVHPDQRVGFSVFDVSPDGALAEVLRTGKPVTGLRNRAKGSNAEVVSNATPVYLNGEMAGAVCVFQDVTNLLRLTRHLQESTAMITRLNERLTQLARAQYSFADLIGNSPRMREAVDIATRAAESGSTVLILGESGTGKELFAHAIHQASRRAAGPFVVLNAAAIPENLLESELFGHEKGAFTGAVQTKIGRFELAHGGTIFLDEIGDMSPNLQAKLLRILQLQRFERVGGLNTIAVDVRIITATNRDLRKRIHEGLFREDLYYRLNVMRVEIPPLRERRDDIPDLVHCLLHKLNRKLGTQVTEVGQDTWKLILEYDWPGNVRELENLLEAAMNLAEGRVLPRAPVARHVFEARRHGTLSEEKSDRSLTIAEMESKAIGEALQRFGTSVEGKKMAAKSLGISLSTLYARLRDYGLKT